MYKVQFELSLDVGDGLAVALRASAHDALLGRFPAGLGRGRQGA